MAKTKRDDKTSFSQMIERMAITEKCSHIDAIVKYCDETGFEIEMVRELVNIQLKKKIEVEARTLRLLPGESDKLPV